MSEQLVAAYGRSRKTPTDLLIIEQVDWEAYTGGLSKFAMVSQIARLIYGEDKYSAHYECGLADNLYHTAIYVYPLVPGLNYNPSATHGELSERVEELAELSESIQLRLNTVIDIKYPVAEIVSATWQGDCYDTHLALVPPPVLRISADRRSVSVSVPVYGTVVIEYRSERHVYELSVAKREEALENRYSSVVYCVYGGGSPQYLAIKPPPAAEELDGNCAQGGGGINMPDPDDDPPDWPDPHADRTTVYGWCYPHVLISDTTTGV